MNNILEVKNLTKIIKGQKILNDISFDVEKGKVIGLIGKNGAGKSTLLKSIVGLYKINGGNIIINGFDVSKDYKNAIKEVGVMIEAPGLYDYMNAEDNLKVFSMMLKGISEEKIKELLCLVSLEGCKYKKLKTYSLGMRQRLGLAHALINDPKLLILDEPTNGLDPVGISDLREFLKSLKDVTIIISSHLLSEIENICDEVIFIDGGKIVGEYNLKNCGFNLEEKFLSLVNGRQDE